MSVWYESEAFKYLNNHEVRFWSFVNKKTEDECWLWCGCVRKDGRYGIFHVLGTPLDTHKCAYLLSKGEVPKGMLVHHTCENKLCCNPKHLVASTSMDHPDSSATLRRNQTHCKRGHELKGKNLRIWTRPSGTTKRICVACEDLRKATKNANRIINHGKRTTIT